MAAPRPLARAPDTDLAEVAGICFDLDDTFTTAGRIAPAAWRALWEAHLAGLAMIPVTGRPAGWCDLVCRFWPVDGVVGENGAFWFAHDPDARRILRWWARTEAQRAADRRRLDAVAEEVLREVPGARVAADQAFRAADLAIDFAEDAGPLPPEDIARIVRIFEARGANAKVSSIHVNGWYGDYDKRGALLELARERLGLGSEEAASRLVYAGDSPNDAPLFAAFRLSVGVANVRRFLPQLAHPPAFVTRRPEGEGFAELVRRVLRALRGKRPSRPRV